jgi:hypothetical protein
MTNRTQKLSEGTVILLIITVVVLVAVPSGIIAVMWSSRADAQEQEILREFNSIANAEWTTATYECDADGETFDGVVPTQYVSRMRALIEGAEIPKDGGPGRDFYDIYCTFKVQAPTENVTFRARKDVGGDYVLISYVGSSDRFNQIFIVRNRAGSFLEDILGIAEAARLQR